MAEDGSKDQTLNENTGLGQSMIGGAPPQAEPEVEEKIDWKMLTPIIIEEIDEVFDIFDKDKDG
jgi:hypothetical protein